MTEPEIPGEPANHAPSDPLIDEVREIRRRLSERFGNDVRRLAEHLKEVQERHAARVRRLDQSRERRAG